MGAEPERAIGKIRHAAGVHLPPGDVAAHGLAFRRLRQLPGER